MRFEGWSGTWGGVFCVFASASLLTGLLLPFRDDIGLLNEGLLFLLLTLFIASIWGRNVGLLTALVTNLFLNFFFIEPVYKFTVQEPRNIVGLVVFLIVSAIGGTLLSAARQAASEAKHRQAETEVALNLSRALSGQTEPQQALEALCQEVTRAFDAPGAAVLTPSSDTWQVVASAGDASAGRPSTTEERAAAQRALREDALQGLGLTGLDGARPRRIVIRKGRDAAFARERIVAMVPLRVGPNKLGVLRLDGPIGDSPFKSEPGRLLTAVASEAALAVQRLELASAAAHAQALKETDELKTALLNAVSHDLRTPLASIIASAGSLQQTDVEWTAEDSRHFIDSIQQEAQRLDRLVGNLLDLSRVESGNLRPQKDWYDVAALIEEVVGRMTTTLAGHDLVLDFEEDMPPVLLDYIEIDEVMTNLLENATKYSSANSEITVSAYRRGGNVEVEVADRGQGVPPESLNRLFEPFFRASPSTTKGTGLGLAVAKGLVEAHGGKIWVEPREGGGTLFRFALPLSDVAPQELERAAVG